MLNSLVNLELQLSGLQIECFCLSNKKGHVDQISICHFFHEYFLSWHLESVQQQQGYLLVCL